MISVDNLSTAVACMCERGAVGVIWVRDCTKMMDLLYFRWTVWLEWATFFLTKKNKCLICQMVQERKRIISAFLHFHINSRNFCENNQYFRSTVVYSRAASIIYVARVNMSKFITIGIICKRSSNLVRSQLPSDAMQLRELTSNEE